MMISYQMNPVVIKKKKQAEAYSIAWRLRAMHRYQRRILYVLCNLTLFKEIVPVFKPMTNMSLRHNFIVVPGIKTKILNPQSIL